jgi:mutator protein MutT
MGDMTGGNIGPLNPAQSLPHVRVAAGIILHQGRILIGKRFQHSFMGGLWEFPGGKQEPGETLEECLKREIQEELDIDVVVGPLLTVVEYTYPHFRITLYAFLCNYLHGEPKPRGVADFCWVTFPDLFSYTFPPADLKILSTLKTYYPTLSSLNTTILADKQ